TTTWTRSKRHALPMTRATAKADGEGGQTPSHLGKKIAAFPDVGTGNPVQLQQLVYYDWEQAFRPTDEWTCRVFVPLQVLV
ncbi:hypothetical protein, partial [Antarcticimicrobium sediminis]|uniref:hypothetical protein n=1 Tax=Antarcticimicrobium sediminis TaxID=2546227 RepID=UPI0019D0BD49